MKKPWTKKYAALPVAPPPHPATDDCPDPECMICGARDCPFGEPLHYHHDGCPACSEYQDVIYGAIALIENQIVEQAGDNNLIAIATDNVIHALVEKGMIGNARKEEVAKGRAGQD